MLEYRRQAREVLLAGGCANEALLWGGVRILVKDVPREGRLGSSNQRGDLGAGKWLQIGFVNCVWGMCVH